MGATLDLLVSLLVSLRRSYGSLKVGFQKSSVWNHISKVFLRTPAQIECSVFNYRFCNTTSNQDDGKTVHSSVDLLLHCRFCHQCGRGLRRFGPECKLLAYTGRSPFCHPHVTSITPFLRHPEKREVTLGCLPGPGRPYGICRFLSWWLENRVKEVK
jgi:hypothetical protein